MPKGMAMTSSKTRAISPIAKDTPMTWENFSVTGIGNMDIARYTLVTLTTVEEFLPDYGSLLIKLLLKERMETTPDDYNVYHIRPEIIERESVYDFNNI